MCVVMRMGKADKDIFFRLAGNGNRYAIKYCDRGTWHTIIAEIVSFDGKFALIRNETEELVLSISSIDGARRV